MARFLENQTLAEFQHFNKEVYGLTDDRTFSLLDLLIQQQRFAMRALKGVRKEDVKKITLNLLIAFAFLNAIASRLHINLEDEVWKRFPTICSYCGHSPCVCKKLKPKKRLKVKGNNALKPRNLAGFQAMFNAIYPASKRTLADAGVHLAEEVGEVNEAVHNFLGQHQSKQFDEIGLEIADCVSCIFGVANSAKINFAHELAMLFKNNCHVCHEAPCECDFKAVTGVRT